MSLSKQITCMYLACRAVVPYIYISALHTGKNEEGAVLFSKLECSFHLVCHLVSGWQWRAMGMQIMKLTLCGQLQSVRVKNTLASLGFIIPGAMKWRGWSYCDARWRVIIRVPSHVAISEPSPGSPCLSMYARAQGVYQEFCSLVSCGKLTI